MTLVFTLLTMAVLGLVAAVAVGRIGGGLDAPASSLPSRGLPETDVAPADIEALTFSPALRGYRMDEVDDAVDRLAVELARRDEEIVRLHDLLGQYAVFEHDARYDNADYVNADYESAAYENAEYKSAGFGTEDFSNQGPDDDDGAQPNGHRRGRHSDDVATQAIRRAAIGDHQAWTEQGGR